VPSTHDDELAIALDRDADVPIGVQLAWALRARILSGALAPGRRLPALHRLAEELGVNANTVRAVYGRLETDGLVETRHGSGTYVTGAPGGLGARGELTQLASGAARAAREAGIDPRELAAALYVGAAPDASTAGTDDEAAGAATRRRLRAQIAALEQALADLLRLRPDLLPSAPPPMAPPRPAEARLLGTAELEQQRAELLRRLAATQTAVDTAPDVRAAESTGKRDAARRTTRIAPTTTRSAKPKLRPAPRTS
jgi:DNA-binding transcriptional regulator YhcF (GntR family)